MDEANEITRKRYVKGRKIKSLDDLVKHDHIWFENHGIIYKKEHETWHVSWLKLIEVFKVLYYIDQGNLYVAEEVK